MEEHQAESLSIELLPNSLERDPPETTLSQDFPTVTHNDDQPSLRPESHLKNPSHYETNDCSKLVQDEQIDLANSSLDRPISSNPTKKVKRSVLFDTVTVYHFTRSQGFSSVPTQGGSTLGMKKKHFLQRKLSVDMFEEVRRRSRREILLKIRFDRERRKTQLCNRLPCSSNSSSSSSSSETRASDSDEDSITDCSDISDSELESENCIFVQPLGVKVRRSLLRASGVNRIDPKEKKECKRIRDSRSRSGCSCVNQCIPGLCECSNLGVNCHVDRHDFPCGCHSQGCRNPQGRTEFDSRMVKLHLVDTLLKEDLD